MKVQLFVAALAAFTLPAFGSQAVPAVAGQGHVSQITAQARVGIGHSVRRLPLTYTSYSFPSSGLNGKYPGNGSLIDVGGTIYGTTSLGGLNGSGSVFKIDLALSAGSESAIYSFGQNSPDGALPQAGLLRKGQWLYGAAEFGGANSFGTIFRLKPSNPIGTYSTVYNFAGGTDGWGPIGSLIRYSGRFWGTTYLGGAAYGTVFSLDNSNTESPCFVLNGPGGYGANPTAGLVQSGSDLYGLTSANGANGVGTVFKIHVNTNHTCSSVWASPFGSTLNDGATPNGGLVKVGNKLYGTATGGGANGYGTIFMVSASTGNPQTIYSFQAGGTNGTTPAASLIYVGSENALYGTTEGGGGSTNCTLNGNVGCGTVFKYALPSGPLTTIYPFQGSPDGQVPVTGLLNDPNGPGFYGTTEYGGTGGNGTIFRLN